MLNRYKQERSVAFKIHRNPFSAGALPPTPLGELTTLPQTRYSAEEGTPSHTTPHIAPTHLRRSPCVPQNSSQIHAYVITTKMDMIFVILILLWFYLRFVSCRILWYFWVATSYQCTFVPCCPALTLVWLYVMCLLEQINKPTCVAVTRSVSTLAVTATLCNRSSGQTQWTTDSV